VSGLYSVTRMIWRNAHKAALLPIVLPVNVKEMLDVDVHVSNILLVGVQVLECPRLDPQHKY
jgi:hypothetical protein